MFISDPLCGFSPIRLGSSTQTLSLLIANFAAWEKIKKCYSTQCTPHDAIGNIGLIQPELANSESSHLTLL